MAAKPGEVLYGLEVCGRVYFGVCRPHHCLANSRTYQDLALRFPGLSRTKLIFQDFPGPENFTEELPGLSRRRENAGRNTHQWGRHHWWLVGFDGKRGPSVRPILNLPCQLCMVHADPITHRQGQCADNLHQWWISLSDKLLLWSATDDEPYCEVMSADCDWTCVINTQDTVSLSMFDDVCLLRRLVLVCKECTHKIGKNLPLPPCPLLFALGITITLCPTVDIYSDN